MRYPRKQKLNEMDQKLKNTSGANPLPNETSKLDRFKYEFCKKIVQYIIEDKLSQKDLVDALEIDPTIF